MSTNLDELGGSCIIPNVHNYPRDTDYDGYNDTRTHDTEGRDVRMPSGRNYQEDRGGESRIASGIMNKIGNGKASKRENIDKKQYNRQQGCGNQ